MNKIRLTDDQRQYIINGKVYSRVSDIAGAGEKLWLEQWKKRVGTEEAERIAKETAEYGELVHEITMWSDKKKGRKVDEILMTFPFASTPLLLWQKWVHQYIEKWILIETVIWSNKWMAAGRVDRVAIIKGDKNATIVDIKTGSLNDDIGIQIYGGYVPIYNEWRMKHKKSYENILYLKGGPLLLSIRLPKATRALAINLPRTDPSAIHVKDYTKSKYLDEFESKAELFRSMNK